MKRTSERPGAPRACGNPGLPEDRAATKLPVLKRQSNDTSDRIAAAAPLDEWELAAWQVTLDHLAATGFPGIAPSEVVAALAARQRFGRRRHLQVVP
ncbi:hypothetical protein FHU33_3913 [Blastococcus colisei]|uniref:Uncharacterized protein n=1 Tax=Blastococcus colisei TaxID=1564162 RepID=A0A543PK10_9ACTN|nr:hypothetical protein [Blastococcus colisei]TQN44411.1 hypothetical protein FHU33_3913 [Blastococcus colisei]